MKVISDSSPLIFLSAIGLLDILRIEFGDVLIPEVVYREVTVNNLKGSEEVKDADWIKVVSVRNMGSLPLLPVLDAGEKRFFHKNRVKTALPVGVNYILFTQ